MKSILEQESAQQILAQISQANAAFDRLYPGDSERRQPVHTVYGGAQIFTAETARKLGGAALASLQEYAPDCIAFARALRMRGSETFPTAKHDVANLLRTLEKNPESVRASNKTAWLADTMYRRVIEKLKTEAVEDFRIDFEDGYGNRSDAEEDGHAIFTAKEVARGMKEGLLPPFIGIRIKPFTEELKERSIRTLDLFLSNLIAKSNNRLPKNFVVTLPKVVTPEQIGALVDLFDMIEERNNLTPGSLKMEFMVETPQSVIDYRGASPMPLFVEAAEGRCVAAHFGVYDYTASMNITAAYQSMDHAACDFARSMMKVSLAGTGVWISDGATNIMPVGPHRPSEGKPLTPKQKDENRDVVHRAWKLAFDHTTHSLVNGYYQGWDLHPAQLPVRYAAVYLFFLEGLEAASNRLKTFVEKAAQASLIGDVFDDAATGQGLLNYFLRGMNCGAISLSDTQTTGLTVEEIQSRSFVKILNGRKQSQQPRTRKRDEKSDNNTRTRHNTRNSRRRGRRRS